MKTNHLLQIWWSVISRHLQVISLFLSSFHFPSSFPPIPAPVTIFFVLLFYSQINLSHFVQNWSCRLLLLMRFCKPLSLPHLNQYCSFSSPLSRFLSAPLCIPLWLITNGAPVLCPLTWKPRQKCGTMSWLDVAGIAKHAAELVPRIRY